MEIKTYVLFALLNGSVAVGVGHLGLLAEGAGDDAVDEAQDGDDAQCDGNNAAIPC